MAHRTQFHHGSTTRSPRPELSQHFLMPWAARHIVRRVNGIDGPIIEFGAGDGALTAALADTGLHVIAIEKDARLFRSLRARFSGRSNVECHVGDALALPLPSGRYSVVSNVPYNATAAIVRRLVDATPPPLEAVLVLQREAAWKFAGVPHETVFLAAVQAVARPAYRGRRAAGGVRTTAAGGIEPAAHVTP